MITRQGKLATVIAVGTVLTVVPTLAISTFASARDGATTVIGEVVATVVPEVVVITASVIAAVAVITIAPAHGCANHDIEGKRFKSPVHCCDVTKPPCLFSGELCTSPLQCKLLFVYTVCCRRTGQCFSVLRTRKSDVIVT